MTSNPFFSKRWPLFFKRDRFFPSGRKWSNRFYRHPVYPCPFMCVARPSTSQCLLSAALSRDQAKASLFKLHGPSARAGPAIKSLTIRDDDIKIIGVSVDFSCWVLRSANRPVFHLARPRCAAAMTKHVCPSLEPAATKTRLLLIIPIRRTMRMSCPSRKATNLTQAFEWH